MKVLYLCWNYPSDANPAGGSFFCNQVEALQTAGALVTVATPVPYFPPLFRSLKQDWSKKASLPRNYTYRGVQVYLPRFFRAPYTLSLGLTPYAIVRAVEALSLGRFDVVHGHFAYPFGFAAHLLSQRWNARSALTLHGSDVNQYPYRSIRDRQRFVRAINSVDAVMSVTEDMARQTEEFSGRRPIHLPIGIDVDRFRPKMSKAQARESLGIPYHYRVLIYVGALLDSKGVPELIEAAQGLPENVLVLVIGDGPLRDRVESCKRMRWIAPIANDKVVDYLAASDGFVLPSHSEGMPTVLVEAGAAGIPVAATAVSGIPELLSEDRGILFPAKDIPALKSAIQKLVDDPAAAAARAQRLADYVRNRHDAKKNARELVTIYNAILESRDQSTVQPGTMADRASESM
ncbi:MAG TPA: glycosyltransferase [Candidatus Koribacter sp.]|jgi:teichuronic acid biosynthesis glycosyltransferase TuaC